MDLSCLVRLVRLNRILRLSILPDDLILRVAREATGVDVESIIVRDNTPRSIMIELYTLYPHIPITMIDDKIIDTSLCI